MSKGMMYLIIGVTATLGGFIPTLWGADALGGQNILGTMMGGFAGIWIFWQLKNAGY